MKKIALFCVVAAVAAGVYAAGDGMKFKFSSANDTYKDGSYVQDGEVYALVWTKTGAFAGFNEDGSLADPVNSDVMALQTALNHGCPATVFIAEEKHAGGFYQVYLLDTRSYSADGVAGAPVGTSDGVTLTTVKGCSAVPSAVFETTSVAGFTTVTVDGSVGAQIPADVVEPVIADLTFDAGSVKILVENTVPYVQYTVKGGTAPGSITDVVGNFLNGNAGGTITLTVENPGKYRFFKVVNK